MTSTAPQPAQPAWMSKVQRTGEVENLRITGLYLGPEQTWKTTMALTWPDPFVFYFDKNTATLENNPDKRPFYCPRSFKEFQFEVLPAIVNRRIDAQTIVIDTASSAAAAAKFEIQGRAESFEIRDYGTLLTRLWSTFDQLLDQKKPKGDHPGYHIIITSIEKEWMRKVGNDLVLDRVRPQIDGDFKNVLPTMVEFTFLSRVRKGAKDSAPEPYVITVPPGPEYYCGDRIGTGTRFRRLPAELDGSFPSLARAWGLPGFEEAPPEAGNTPPSGTTK